MALSLEVSSADVAYRKSLGESLCSPEVPGREDAGCLWRPQGESGFMTCVGEDGCCKVGNCSGIDGRENDRQALGPRLTSSNRMMSGALRMVRAMATRCFSPPLSFRPRSPTCVSYPVDIKYPPHVTCK